jgi:excisionase family DNA binding protein
MNGKYYTVEQISEMLKMHPKTIQRYIREGKLSAVKIGKSWRISGHDLSVFMESEAGQAAFSVQTGDKAAKPRAVASSVVDISVGGKDEAIHLMNALTAAMNSKPPDCGRTSLHMQYIEPEQSIRATLWGSVAVVATILAAIESLIERAEEERRG